MNRNAVERAIAFNRANDLRQRAILDAADGLTRKPKIVQERVISGKTKRERELAAVSFSDRMDKMLTARTYQTVGNQSKRVEVSLRYGPLDQKNPRRSEWEKIARVLNSK